MTIQSILFLVAVFVAMQTAAFELQDSPQGGTHNTEEFPVKGFSFRKCSGSIPVKAGKNPWLKVVKKKTKPAPMNPEPSSWVESYFVTPANKEKRFSIVNQEDSIYSSPTTLARIDCKNGLIYFQNLVHEPVPTNIHRVYDLMTGEEYRVTEGAVTISPDGSYLISASAADRDQKCGHSPSCNVDIKIYQCKQRKSHGLPCALYAEKKYSVSKRGRAASFSPIPLKWYWNRHKKELKATLGGSTSSPSKINCDILPKVSCKVAKKGKLEFTLVE